MRLYYNTIVLQITNMQAPDTLLTKVLSCQKSSFYKANLQQTVP